LSIHVVSGAKIRVSHPLGGAELCGNLGDDGVMKAA
jgi:hypothetical protein